MVKVGVLALQGAFAAHVAALEGLGVATLEVRRPDQLAEADALVVPGGESTTISMLLERSGLLAPLREWLSGDRPVLATCAGTILLADRVKGGRPHQPGLGLLDIEVTRNAYGGQQESFEADLEVKGIEGGAFHAVFIRAPSIDSVGEGVEVLARIEGRPALVRSGSVLGSVFHPELSGDDRIHAMFCNMFDDQQRTRSR